jgi:hypothetical protein
MPRCDRWFLAWASDHIDRHPHHDWPDDDSAFWETWRETFDREGVSVTEAECASRELARQIADGSTPQPFPDLGALAALMKIIRKRRSGSTGYQAESPADYPDIDPERTLAQVREMAAKGVAGAASVLAFLERHRGKPTERPKLKVVAATGERKSIGDMPPRPPDPNTERNRQLEYLEHRKRVADFSSPPPF